MAHPTPHAGHRHHRLRRGQYRQRLALRQPDGWTGQRRICPRPGLLRKRRHRTDSHGRQPGAWPHQHPNRRRDFAPERRRRRQVHPGKDRRPIGHGAAHRRQRHPEHRKQHHGRRHPQRQRGAGPRPPRVCPGRLRRGRADARHRRGQTARHQQGRRSTAPWHSLGLRVASGRVEERLRPHIATDPAGLRPGGHGACLCRDGVRGPGLAQRGGGSSRPARVRAVGRPAVHPPRLGGYGGLRRGESDQGGHRRRD